MIDLARGSSYRGMADSNLSAYAHRRALRLRLKRIHRKIAKVEEEIAKVNCAPTPRFQSLLRRLPAVGRHELPGVDDYQIASYPPVVCPS